MHRQSGFTLAELFIALVVLMAAGFFVYLQWQYSAVSQRDSARKTAVNAMHAYLQEVYLPDNGAYPLKLAPKNITAIAPGQLHDPAGRSVTDPASDLRYEPGNCNEDVCQRYTLRANLEAEADFIRTGAVR